MSGSQPWNGHIGAFTANAIMKPRKIAVLSLGESAVMSNVSFCRPSAMIETSMSSEPAIV